MIIKKCLTCNKDFNIYPSYEKYGRGRFCSKRCARTGKFASRWIGGKRINHNGYIVIRMPNHPNAVNGYIFEHRLIMEKKLGRILKPNEIVHHIDHDKLNNDFSNLIILSKKEHNLQHTKDGRICIFPEYWRKKGYENRQRIY